MEQTRRLPIHRAIGRGALLRAAAVGFVVLAAVVVLTALGFPAERYRHDDFIGFWAGGRSILEGRDPYDVRSWLSLLGSVGSEMRSVVPRETAFGYPLTTALLAVPFAVFPVEIAAPLWLVVQVTLALVALLALSARIFVPAEQRDLLLLLAIMLSSQPMWLLLESGNLGGFLLAITAGSVALLLAGRPLAAGALLGLLVVKPHLFLVFVPVLVVASRDRARVLAGGVAASLAVLLASLAVRPDWVSGWSTAVGRLQAAPLGRVTAWGLAGPDARSLALALVLAAVAAYVVWWRRSRPDLAVLAAVALPLSLFASPYSWSPDHLVLVTTVAVAVALASRLARRPRAIALAVIAATSVPLPWLLFVVAASRGEEAWSLGAPVALAAATVAVEALAARVPPFSRRS